jgi:hypothetical protein
MTRDSIELELQTVAAEWRVPMEHLRGTGEMGTPGRLVIAARAVFIRKMFAECVPTKDVAATLNISKKSARQWYQRLREAERNWFRP